MTRQKPKKTQAQLAFAGWLKAHRDDQGLTAAEAAARAGVDPTTWRSLEAPGMPWHAPSIKTVRGIARVFDVPVNEVAARAGVAVPTLDSYQPAGSPIPPEALDLILRLTEQLTEAQRLHAEALAKLTELSTDGQTARKRRSPVQPRR